MNDDIQIVVGLNGIAYIQVPALTMPDGFVPACEYAEQLMTQAEAVFWLEQIKIREYQ